MHRRAQCDSIDDLFLLVIFIPFILFGPFIQLFLHIYIHLSHFALYCDVCIPMLAPKIVRTCVICPLRVQWTRTTAFPMEAWHVRPIRSRMWPPPTRRLPSPPPPPPAPPRQLHRSLNCVHCHRLYRYNRHQMSMVEADSSVSEAILTVAISQLRRRRRQTMTTIASQSIFARPHRCRTSIQ